MLIIHIHSDGNKLLPLLFIGKNLSQVKRIVVNQQHTISVSLDSLTLRNYAFITKDSVNGTYYAKYTADQNVPVALNELIYFKAPILQNKMRLLLFLTSILVILMSCRGRANDHSSTAAREPVANENDAITDSAKSYTP